MSHRSPQRVQGRKPLTRPVLLGLLLMLGLPWLTSARGVEWQTYLSDAFAETTVFPTGQFGEAFYTVDNGEYMIDGRQASQDSLSALTDSLYYYNVEAECRVAESTAGELAFSGLVFHYKTTLQKLRSYYVFYVYPDGYYGAKRVIGDEVTIVLPLSRSTEINTSGTNTLGVDAQGTRFDLYINGKYVNGFTDVRIDGGGFGFYVSKQTAGAFDNFKVRVEARDMGQEEPEQPETTMRGTGTARGHGRFSIPRDPDRPTYPWEVGGKKGGRDRDREREEEADGERATTREGRVLPPDDEDVDTPVIPPDEQVVIPPAPKKRETKPAPPPEPEPEDEVVVPEPAPDGEGSDEAAAPVDGATSDDGEGSSDSDTYIIPNGRGASDEEGRYYGDGFDKEGAPRKAASRGVPDEEEQPVARPPKSMIALDPPAQTTDRDGDTARAEAEEQQRESQEREDREAARAQREAEEQAREEQQQRERDAERERKRLEREAEEAAERQREEARNDSEEIGAAPAAQDDAEDDGGSQRDRLLTSMRSREWGDEESDTTYIPPRKPRETEAAAPPPEREGTEPDAIDATPTLPASRQQLGQEPVQTQPKKSKRTRDLNVNMGGIGDPEPIREDPTTITIHHTGHKQDSESMHRTGSTQDTDPLWSEQSPAALSPEAPFEEEIKPEPEERVIQPINNDDNANRKDKGRESADENDTVLLEMAPAGEDVQPAVDEPVAIPDDTPIQLDDEEVEQSSSESSLGELRLGGERDGEADDEAFSRSGQEKEPIAAVPLPVATPELGEIPLAPAPMGDKATPKPTVTVTNKTGFFQLKDDFSQQRWPVSDSGASSYRYFGAAYEIDNLKSQTMAISFQDEHMGDMTLAVGSDFLDGAAYVGYGLAARFSNSPQGINYYGLFVSQTGECLLLRVLNGEETVLVDWTASAAFKASQRNVLKIEIADGSVKGYVNGQLAVQCADSTLPAGGYALLAGPGVKVRFDDLELAGTRE